MNPRNPNNNPAVNPDDPKWTAYVLGEVSDAERREIEQLLETSEDARALVEELTLATETLKEELVPDTTLMMSAAQRAAIRSAAEPKPRRWFEVFPSKWGLGLAAAALVVLAVVLPVTWRNEYKACAAGSAVYSTRSLKRSETAAPVANDSDRAKDAAGAA
jgi:anti-sigma factor RsiW